MKFIINYTYPDCASETMKPSCRIIDSDTPERAVAIVEKAYDWVRQVHGMCIPDSSPVIRISSIHPV